MSISFLSKILMIDGQPIQMPWPVLDAIEHDGRVFVLFDPDSYLLNPDYKKMRRQGAPAIKNLVAIDKSGNKLWEADLPTASDYYYRISSVTPLIVNSFSSYRCEIDSKSGVIKDRELLK